MTVQECNVGDRMQVPTTFTNAAGAVADPTTVTFRFDSPSKANTVYVYGVDGQLVRDSTGVYHVNIDPDEAGLWSWRFEGTGAIVAANQGQFRALASLVPA